MHLTGYPGGELALRSSFVDASRATVEQLARDLDADGLGHLPVVVGYLDRVDPAEQNVDERPDVFVPKGAPQNAAAVLYRGRVVARYAKHHLPNYGVFDEFRIFTPGRDLTVVRVKRRRRGDRHLRGHLAGRRPRGVDPPRGRRTP